MKSIYLNLLMISILILCAVSFLIYRARSFDKNYPDPLPTQLDEGVIRDSGD